VWHKIVKKLKGEELMKRILSATAILIFVAGSALGQPELRDDRK
jgi:hypothetical protein